MPPSVNDVLKRDDGPGIRRQRGDLASIWSSTICATVWARLQERLEYGRNSVGSADLRRACAHAH
jgi:hypothetical protein